MTTKDMLKALLKGQQDTNSRLDSLEQSTNARFDSIELEMRQGFREIHERLDKQGKYLAYLEEDAPTRKEFDILTKRVKKLEQS